MRNKVKNILSIIAAATLLTSTVALTACRDGNYTGKALPGYVAHETTQTDAVSNGGFAVQKDDYVYFINGTEDYTVANEYGEVVKGALMRIKKADLDAGNYANTDTVVPMLFVAQNFNSGIYIYGDYVYYATPTTDKSVSTGEVESSWIDFKRAKLDGSETMKGYYFRLSTNSANYRFVKGDDGVVYCLYEEDSALKSFNTETLKTTVLVEGAGTFYYDMKDLTNPNVYYTMGVTYNVDSDMATTATYNQIYSVNAATTATVNEDNASYAVNVYNKATNAYETYRTYSFDKAYLEAQNEEAKQTAKDNNTDYEATYVFDDYTTYPYVNLGTLVLDGVGSKSNNGTLTQYNDAAYATTPRAELQGYTYTITRYENGGVYYTRAEVSPNTNLYYLPEAAARDTVAANAQADIVANNTTNASTTAVYVVNTDAATGARTHTYLYLSGNSIYKATTGVKDDVKITGDASGATLWMTEGNDLYYYASGTNPVTSASTSGYNLIRIDYTGSADDYKALMESVTEAKFKPAKLTYVDFNSSWYKPEIFGDILLYSNAAAVGSNSYNYIYAAKMDTAEQIEAYNEQYEAVYEFIESYDENSQLRDVMTYYYRTGRTTEYEAVKDLYDDYQQEKFQEFVDEIAADKYILETDLINLIGKVNADDQEAMNQAWANFLLTETVEEEEDDSLAVWQICLIVAAGVIVLAAAVAVPVILLSKKKAKKAEAEATVNAYKRKKIDTTDDKSIDVYADEETEEPVENAEETSQE